MIYRSRDCSASQAVLDFLDARVLSLMKAKLQKVTSVLKFAVSKRGGNSLGSGIVEKGADTTKSTDVVEVETRCI